MSEQCEEISPGCDTSECFTRPDKGFTCTKKFTSSSIDGDGNLVSATKKAFGSSTESKEAACAQALERAQDAANELLRLKLLS